MRTVCDAERPGLKPRTAYYWRVDGLDDKGGGTCKEKVWRFQTSGWNTEKGMKNLFSGSISRLTVYDYARTADEFKAAAGR